MARKRKNSVTSVAPNPTAILIVEDELDHALFIRDILAGTRIPLRVSVVESGEEAIAYLAGEGKYADRAMYPFPALVLLDLRMPGIGGFGVLRWLCARPQLKENLSLAVLSAVQSEREIEVVYELGAQHFWLKADGRALQERIRYWHASCRVGGPRPGKSRKDRMLPPPAFPETRPMLTQLLN